MSETSTASGLKSFRTTPSGLTDHWTVKAEYLHVGFAQRTVSITPLATYTFDFKDKLDIGRVGINYKF